ncbi:putative glutathione S-transferase kappa 1 [Mycena pura]|uniref:Glutathione S-transferase kappa n=1 Tax=Mycena pura TaxID=153505 RepID=A0AAD6Y047_9AGAR|nr:putative glutathione S-transferase kappa 1 [Mycena pura]
MAGHIDCFLDCSSFYSYVAFVFLLKHRDVLATHEVSIEFHPMLAGGVFVASGKTDIEGNKSPMALPAKAKYQVFDARRSVNHHGLPGVAAAAPPFFPARTVLPQRALCYIKAVFPRDAFERAWLALFRAFWTPPHVNLAEPELFRTVLNDCGLFSAADVDAILAAAGQQQWKDCLLDNTKKALDLGAFGAPWMWVRNAQGEEEPFFGSDRFHFMWEYLGLPWKDFELLPRPAKL